MFELSVACKYLTPRWRQLSVSIISLVSMLVIALVVWLIVVFFSVTHGLEKMWVQKLTALTAPVRITPTEAYYKSYYYQIDGLSSVSDYTLKSIGEKFRTVNADPYDPTTDQELPKKWVSADLNADGSVKDIVKTAFQLIENVPNVRGIRATDFEMTVGNLRLYLIRQGQANSDTSISQTTYLGTFDPVNPALQHVLLPLRDSDHNNLSFILTSARKELAPNFVAHLENQKLVLPTDTLLGEGLLLPKSYQNGGALVGDRGFISYYGSTTSSVQEQQLPVYVAGFYDPGIIPIGNKYILANSELINLIQTSQHQNESQQNNGINVRFDNIADADEVKSALVKAFEKAGIASYWRIETYREYEFTKDLLQQLRSERNLWTLLATVIIIVACSNIISMLIILVNDKKIEIGILRSMGASSASIAAIFGICGMVMGAAGSIMGTIAAIITLKNLQVLVDFIGRMQGYDMFNPLFYGNTLPNEFSFEALTFVIITTSFISLLAGIVPAIKASLLRPSTILRSE